MTSTTRRELPRSILVTATLLSFATVCAILYWAQLVLIPLALASLLTFLLNPVVTRLERWRLPRMVAVIVVTALMAATLGGIGLVVTRQTAALANRIPEYKGNIKAKIVDMREMFRGGAIQKVQSTFQDITQEIEQEQRSTLNEEDGGDAGTRRAGGSEARQDSMQGEGSAEEAEPIAVQVEAAETFLPETAAILPYLEVLATAGLVLILAIFMLMKREDLRNRLVSMTGQSSLAVTTKALDEAGQRISRYLLMQFIINTSFGLAVGLGLFFIGLPYSALWGLCAAVFRYIPYVGPWVAALLPIGVGLIHFPGWSTALLVIGLFLVLELISNNVVEPLLYGQTVGLSEVAIIVAAVFWTWLWGPVGLVLSTPLTVCLVVLGKYVPALSIFDRLLGDRAALKPHVSLYQRLLARDEAEAEEIVEEYLEQHSLATACDDLLLPVLALTKRDRVGGRIIADDEEFILSAMCELIDDLPAPPADLQVPAPPQPVLIIGFSIHDRADELTLDLLRRLLHSSGCKLQILSADMLIAEKLGEIEKRRPACVCLPSLPPGDLALTRQICKRLRLRFPELKILVGRWAGRAASAKTRELLRAAGADQVVSSLAEMRESLLPIVQFHPFVEPAREEPDVVAYTA